MNILICVGTRSEYMKLKPIIKLFKKQSEIQYKILFTGQHTDILVEMKPDYWFKISEGPNRTDSIMSSILIQSQLLLSKGKFSHIMVQGDSPSAYSMSISAFNNKVKIIHIESGIRSNRLKTEEEIIRKSISIMANIHFCPTEMNYENLVSEKIVGEKYVVGNTSLDNIVNLKTTQTNKILISIHKSEIVKSISKWVKSIENLAKDYQQYEFIFMSYPNPLILPHLDKFKNVKISDTLLQEDFLKLLSECLVVITDSDGVQEEASFLKKRTILCRKVVSRTESLGKSAILCNKPEMLKYVFKAAVDHPIVEHECPFGDGHTAEKVVNILKEISLKNKKKNERNKNFVSSYK